MKFAQKEFAERLNPEDYEGYWEVDEKGNLDYVRNKNVRYRIYADELTDPNWIDHLLGKGWCDMNTFLRAYAVALKNAGIENVTITFRVHSYAEQ